MSGAAISNLFLSEVVHVMSLASSALAFPFWKPLSIPIFNYAFFLPPPPFFFATQIHTHTCSRAHTHTHTHIYIFVLLIKRGKDIKLLRKEGVGPPKATSYPLLAYMWAVRFMRSVGNAYIATYNYTLGLVFGPMDYYTQGKKGVWETEMYWCVFIRIVFALA